MKYISPGAVAHLVERSIRIAEVVGFKSDLLPPLSADEM